MKMTEPTRKSLSFLRKVERDEHGRFAGGAPKHVAEALAEMPKSPGGSRHAKQLTERALRTDRKSDHREAASAHRSMLKNVNQHGGPAVERLTEAHRVLAEFHQNASRNAKDE